MKLTITQLSKALSKAYLKQNVNRIEIDCFKANLKTLFQKAENADKKGEHEEHFKNIVSHFLIDTWYKNLYEINISKRKDLVIHNGKSATDTIGVIIEAKKPDNVAEMITAENLNVKALWELILYYFEEREQNKNIEIKHLVANNVYDWCIFDENDFDKLFYRNVKFQKLYKTKIESGKDNPFFYSEAHKIIAELTDEIPCVHFNFKDYGKIAFNNSDADDEQLIDLYKILSPEHLLKKPFANDSNSLNKNFYNELLHILGLEEKPEGSKKLINRKSDGKREEGSLLENTISFIAKRRKDAGNEKELTENDIYSIALELCITWLNRILFLKLLEGQLVKYHNSNQDFLFLNSKKIKDFDELQELFFDVLAIKTENRDQSVNEKFGNIPYLNSSLFEDTDYEKKYVYLSNLKDRYTLPLHQNSVLKNNPDYKNTESLNTLQYLFEFLSAYNFSSDTGAKIQEDNKTIINASVLGLIFEKINGYKDGSFFTPGFITMYMCRETIRRAVAQKFKELENKKIDTFDDVKKYCSRYFKKEDIQRFNKHINSLKICDPAVGSGHFLVSALNEIIAIKSELDILYDSEGTPLDYEITVDNDELIIIHKRTNRPFEYVLGEDDKPSKELQKVQVALFHEKQNIIENCLFGVDINQKSVLICRLRLWIELLKNAYYIIPENLPAFSKPGSVLELQTLPNIDINIKTGNSLISRFPLDSSLKQIAKTSKWTIFSYQNAVLAYKNSVDKSVKWEIEKLINDIKANYINNIQQRNPILQKYYKLQQEYDYKYPENGLFAHEPEHDYGENKNKREEEKQRLALELQKVKEQVDNEKTFYERNNAFEWRFEFPEVLNEDGDFMGFDVVIGNPPYGVDLNKNITNYYDNLFKQYTSKNKNSTIYFMFLAEQITHKNGHHSMIIPKSICYSQGWNNAVNLILDGLLLVVDVGKAFEKVLLEQVIYLKSNNHHQDSYYSGIYLNNSFNTSILSKNVYRKNNVLLAGLSPDEIKVLFKILDNNTYTYGDFVEIRRGLNWQSKSVKNNKLTPIYRGAHLNKYDIEETDDYVDLSNFPGKEYEYQLRPKVLNQLALAHVKNPYPHFYIQTAIDTDNKLVFETISCTFLKDKSLDLRFILGFNNSELFAWLLYKFIYSNAIRSTRFDEQYICRIPVPDLKKVDSNAIIKLVDQILFIKKANPQADTSQLEAEIDKMVYRLYEFTDEEIAIVEGRS